MKISNFDSRDVQFRKMLYNIQKYMDKSRQNKHIKPNALASDLYDIGEKCKTPERENILNNCLTSLADNMMTINQDNLAGIIYSFLIKFNKDNPVKLKQILPKALNCAKIHDDSVHIAARCDELSKIYQCYEIHGSNYLSCLKLRKKALKNICLDYEAVKGKYRTISRQLNSKDKYVELLIRTKIDIANELKHLEFKHDSRKELLSAYKYFDKFSDDYKAKNEKNYSGLKKYLSITLTNATLCKGVNFNSDYEQFAAVAKNIINSTKEKAPVENSMFNDFYSRMYDKFKSNSQESIFINKSFELIKSLNNLGNSFLSNNIIRILIEKNQSNVKNLKDIELEILKVRDNGHDDFGMLQHSRNVQKLFKKDPKLVTISSYLTAYQYNIKALNNIISNYDKLSVSQNSRLQPKDEYVKELIFSKVNTARLQRNTYPEYFKSAVKDADELIESLPSGYIAQHPEMKKVVEYVMRNIDEIQ